MDKKTYDKGLEIRSHVVGKRYVEKPSKSAKGVFTQDPQPTHQT